MDRITGWQDLKDLQDRVLGLAGRKQQTGLQDYKITRLQDYKITRLQDYKITRLQDYKITRLQDYKITRFTG